MPHVKIKMMTNSASTDCSVMPKNKSPDLATRLHHICSTSVHPQTPTQNPNLPVLWRLPDKVKEPSIPEKKALWRRYTFPPPKLCQRMNITVKFLSFRMNLDITG